MSSLFVTPTGSKYHLSTCPHAKNGHAATPAELRGKEPCKICCPRVPANKSDSCCAAAAARPAMSSTSTAFELYVTRTGTKYHTPDCPFARTGRVGTAAEIAGLSPCSKCNPRISLSQGSTQHETTAPAPARVTTDESDVDAALVNGGSLRLVLTLGREQESIPIISSSTITTRSATAISSRPVAAAASPPRSELSVTAGGSRDDPAIAEQVPSSFQPPHAKTRGGDIYFKHLLTVLPPSTEAVFNQRGLPDMRYTDNREWYRRASYSDSLQQQRRSSQASASSSSSSPLLGAATASRPSAAPAGLSSHHQQQQEQEQQEQRESRRIDDFITKLCRTSFETTPQDSVGCVYVAFGAEGADECKIGRACSKAKSTRPNNSRNHFGGSGRLEIVDTSFNEEAERLLHRLFQDAHMPAIKQAGGGGTEWYAVDPSLAVDAAKRIARVLDDRACEIGYWDRRIGDSPAFVLRDLGNMQKLDMRKTEDKIRKAKLDACERAMRV